MKNKFRFQPTKKKTVRGKKAEQRESQRQSGMGATICQAQGPEFDSCPGQNINEKKDDDKYSFCQTIDIHSVLLQSKSVDDHRLECTRVKKEIKK